MQRNTHTHTHTSIKKQHIFHKVNIMAVGFRYTSCVYNICKIIIEKIKVVRVITVAVYRKKKSSIERY